MPAFLALRSVSARHRRIPPVIYKLRRSPGLDRSHYPVESRNPEMSCAVSRGFSTIGKCPASSMAANRAPRIRCEASSADCQENWTSWRPDSWEVFMHGGVATPQRKPCRHERPAAVSRHPRRDDRVHPCSIREARVVEDGVGQEFPNALRARCSEEAGEEERQIHAGCPSREFGREPGGVEDDDFRHARRAIERVDEGRDGLAIRREGAVFSREQGAEALTRQVGRNPRMASADHPSNAEPNLRPGGPPVEQKDGKSARGAAL